MNNPTVPSAGATWLSLPFPLRANFTATVVIPRNLTKAEAKRLTTFIESLAPTSNPDGLPPGKG